MKRKLLYLSIATLFFVACKKDLDDIKKIKKDGVTLVDWNPTFVAPLVNSRSTLGQGFDNFTEQIKELENSGLKIKQRNDGVFVVCYDFELESQGMNDYYVLPRHDENISLVVSEEKLNDIKSLPVGSSIDGIWDSTFAFDMTPPYGALLELLETSGGSIDLDFSHNFNQDLGLEVTFRSVKDRSTNNMLTTTLSGSTDQESILIDNHRFNLTYVDPIDGQTKYNRIEINVRTVGTITDDNLTGDRFGMDLSIGDYYLKYVQGYLGEFSTELKVGVDTFDFFDNINLEGMYLKEPKLKMDFESTIGMPMILKIDTFAFGYQNGTLESVGVDNKTVLIEGVTSRSQIPNSPKISKDSIDYNNSRLAELLTSEPNSIVYGFNFGSTANGASDLTKFFLNDESKIKVKSTVELPLIFSVFDYEFSDTIVTDSVIKKEKADTTKKYLEKAELKIVFETQLPFDITVQGFVLDDNDEVIDMLFPAGGHKVLANDNVSADGSVNSVKEVTTFVSIDQQKFNNIASSKKIVYKVNGNTSNVKKVNEPVYVKLKSDYLFGIRAGLLAEFKYEAPKITFENEKE